MDNEVRRALATLKRAGYAMPPTIGEQAEQRNDDCCHLLFLNQQDERFLLSFMRI